MLLYLDVGVQVVIQVFLMALCNNVDQHSADTGQQRVLFITAFILKHSHIFSLLCLSNSWQNFFMILDQSNNKKP